MTFTSRPRSIRSILVRRILGAAWAASCITIGLSLSPVEMTFVAPEHGAAQVEAATDVAHQCKALPANTLPGGALIKTDTGRVFYTEQDKKVDLAFDMALGTPWPGVSNITLCK